MTVPIPVELSDNLLAAGTSLIRYMNCRIVQIVTHSDIPAKKLLFNIKHMLIEDFGMKYAIYIIKIVKIL